MSLATAALTLLAVLAAAGPAAGAEVSTEHVGQPGVTPESFRLHLVAAAGEPNQVAVTLVGTTPDTATYSVRDLATPPSPGAGCTPGEPAEVLCTTGRSRGMSGCNRVFCSDAGARVLIDLAVDDGDDVIDLASLPANDGGGGQLGTRVDAGSGDDAVSGSPTSDEVEPGPGADSVTTGAGTDFVTARSGGPDGADLIDLGPGSYDAVSYEFVPEDLTITVDGNADDGAPEEGDNVLGAETVDGGDGDDLIVGAQLPDSQQGSVFVQLIDGNGGADRIVGGPGPDAIQGGSLVGPDEADTIEAGGGDDFVQAAAGDDTVLAGAGQDNIDAGDGADLVQGSSGHDDLDGEGGRDRIEGGPGDDTLGGGPDRDTIFGGAGGDRLFGHAGRDLLSAADGDHDRLDCGGGDDRSRVDRHDTSDNCER